MSDTSGHGGIPPEELRGLEELGGTFLANERDIRVAVMNAIDDGHDLRAVAEAAQLPLSLVEEWTGERRAPAADDGATGDTGGPEALDQVAEQRRLRTGTLRQRVDAADAKSARAAGAEGEGESEE